MYKRQSLDTAALVHFAHAVGLGFLLYEAVGAANPQPDEWDAVIARVLSAIVSPNSPQSSQSHHT